jgi:hypothetical protein
MPLTSPGSTWKKWDLHVHTPESFAHNYPGDKVELELEFPRFAGH